MYFISMESSQSLFSDAINSTHFKSQTECYDKKREHWLGSPDQKNFGFLPQFNPTLTQPNGKLFGRYFIHITTNMYQVLLPQNNIKIRN